MKLHRQMLDRSLALRLMALIVTIAGLCLPSSASAHDGHGPGHRAHGVSRIAARAPAVARADPTLLVPSHFTPSAIVRSAVPRLSAPAACGESCCTGGCDGACCSAIGLAPAEGGAAPAPALTGPVPDGAASARIEGAPVCLPEPPRPLA